jgi:glycolate oxidase
VDVTERTDSPALDGAREAGTLHHLVALARRRLSDEAWDYVSGGTETETTMLRNRLALDSLAFNPRVLQDVSAVDLTGRFLGHDVRLPVLLAPIGSLSLADPDGAAAVARAATEFGTINFVSSVTTPSLEEVAASGTSPMVFQLYVRGDQAWIDDYTGRAHRAGYIAVCITVDSAYYSRRERDQIRGYVPPGRRTSGGYQYQAALSWDTLRRTIAASPLPIILKGVTHPEDAEQAVEEGVRAIYVSNHGGRQLDHGGATIDHLPDIVAAVGGKAEIVLDGAIMRGSDVVKALALGADAVAIGKLQVWALAAGGDAGLVRALELLEIEVRLSMALLGAGSIAQLTPGQLRPAAPVASPGITSAFPFLAQEFPGIR